MKFDEIVATLERAFSLELATVDGTTVFEVASEDGGTKVQVSIQNVDQHQKVLMSADIGEPPPEGLETLLRSMMEANNLFEGTAGATLAMDAATGRFRLQAYESQDVLGDSLVARMETFIETALFWSRTIADYRPSSEEEETVPHAIGDIRV